MYLEPSPKYFTAEEFFSKQTVLIEGTGNKIWRLLDWRMAWTITEIREHFKKPITLNTYKYGGKAQHRGYRPANELIDLVEFSDSGNLVPSFSSFSSQHCFGRALDFDIRDISAEEVREDIKINYVTAKRYRYITSVEEAVNWVHIDCRSWDVVAGGLLLF